MKTYMGGKVDRLGKKLTSQFFPGERLGRPGFSAGKKLTGGKFRPVTPALWKPSSRLLQGDFECTLALKLDLG